jgi:hypothetical protein
METAIGRYQPQQYLSPVTLGIPETRGNVLGHLDFGMTALSELSWSAWL